MPLSDSYNGISIYKLPFNICTIMAILAPCVQFNSKLKPIKSTVVMLSMASSLMWMCYPGSALNGQPPFSYIVFQTFMYHGFLFIWSVLNVSLSEVTFNIKHCFKVFIGILAIFVWALFCNTLYPNQNWFFIEESIFPFLSDKVMPVAVIFSVFGVCLALYGIYYLLIAITQRIESKQKDALQNNK